MPLKENWRQIYDSSGRKDVGDEIERNAEELVQFFQKLESGATATLNRPEGWLKWVFPVCEKTGTPFSFSIYVDENGKATVAAAAPLGQKEPERPEPKQPQLSGKWRSKGLRLVP